jgi:hypothetical protein
LALKKVAKLVAWKGETRVEMRAYQMAERLVVSLVLKLAETKAAQKAWL